MGREGIRCIFFFNILDGTPPLDTAHGESSGITKASDGPQLPFQWRGNSLVDDLRISQIDDIDVSPCSSDDQQTLRDIKRIHTLL